MIGLDVYSSIRSSCVSATMAEYNLFFSDTSTLMPGLMSDCISSGTEEEYNLVSAKGKITVTNFIGKIENDYLRQR